MLYKNKWRLEESYKNKWRLDEVVDEKIEVGRGC